MSSLLRLASSPRRLLHSLSSSSPFLLLLPSSSSSSPSPIRPHPSPLRPLFFPHSPLRLSSSHVRSLYHRTELSGYVPRCMLPTLESAESAARSMMSAADSMGSAVNLAMHKKWGDSAEKFLESSDKWSESVALLESAAEFASPAAMYSVEAKMWADSVKLLAESANMWAEVTADTAAAFKKVAEADAERRVKVAEAEDAVENLAELAERVKWVRDAAKEFWPKGSNLEPAEAVKVNAKADAFYAAARTWAEMNKEAANEALGKIWALVYHDNKDKIKQVDYDYWVE